MATSNVSCTICSENYKTNESLLGARCGHVYHKACLEEWLRRSKTCPVCRQVNHSNHPIYLQLDEPTEKEEDRTQSLLQMKISSLTSQCKDLEATVAAVVQAFPISDKGVDELTRELEYANTLNLSYEQEQVQSQRALQEAQDELKICKDEYKSRLKYAEELNARYKARYNDIKTKLDIKLSTLESYEQALIKKSEDLKECEKKLEDALKHIKRYETYFQYNTKEYSALKYEHERKIDKLLKQQKLAENKNQKKNIDKNMKPNKIENKF